LFLIGTNHENFKRHASRRPRKLPLLPPQKQYSTEATDADRGGDEKDNIMETTCINMRTDADDEIVYTNKEIHGSAVLPDFVG
jgi:hypothetical protein